MAGVTQEPNGKRCAKTQNRRTEGASPQSPGRRARSCRHEGWARDNDVNLSHARSTCLASAPDGVTTGFFSAKVAFLDWGEGQERERSIPFPSRSAAGSPTSPCVAPGHPRSTPTARDSGDVTGPSVPWEADSVNHIPSCQLRISWTRGSRVPRWPACSPGGLYESSSHCL